jgi:hypothetical protein
MFPFLLSGCASNADDTAANDLRLVYCLAQGRERSVAEAAVRLGFATTSDTPDHLMVAGRDILVTSWRGPDFERACDAVMAADRNQAPPSGTPPWLTTLLATVNAVALLLVGAIVTLATGGLRDAGTRRRIAAGQLRTAVEGFTAVLTAYLDAKVDTGGVAPGEQVVRDRGQELARALRAVRAVHKKSPDPVNALTRLRDDLGESALRGWELRDDQETEAEVARLRTSMTDLVTEIDVVTGWLERSALSRLGGAA